MKRRRKKYGNKKTLEETSQKTISSEELVKPKMELLKEGSEGSKICDDVEEEINGLISEKSTDKDISEKNN